MYNLEIYDGILEFDPSPNPGHEPGGPSLWNHRAYYKTPEFQL